MWCFYDSWRQEVANISEREIHQPLHFSLSLSRNLVLRGKRKGTKWGSKYIESFVCTKKTPKIINRICIATNHLAKYDTKYDIFLFLFFQWRSSFHSKKKNIACQITKYYYCKKGFRFTPANILKQILYTQISPFLSNTFNNISTSKYISLLIKFYFKKA